MVTLSRKLLFLRMTDWAGGDDIIGTCCSDPLDSRQHRNPRTVVVGNLETSKNSCHLPHTLQRPEAAVALYLATYVVNTAVTRFIDEDADPRLRAGV